MFRNIGWKTRHSNVRRTSVFIETWVIFAYDDFGLVLKFRLRPSKVDCQSIIHSVDEFIILLVDENLQKVLKWGSL